MSEGSLRSPSRSTRSSCVAVSACVHMPIDTWPTRSSVDVDKPCATRLGSSNIVPFHMLSIVSSYVLFFLIFDFKMSWLEIQLEVTQGYGKWTTATYVVVHEILVENLEIFIPRWNFENLLGVHKTRMIGLRYNIGTWRIDLLYQYRASVC